MVMSLPSEIFPAAKEVAAEPPFVKPSTDPFDALASPMVISLPLLRLVS